MFVTPEMFGAPANGVDDDGPAINAAFAVSPRVWLSPGKAYCWHSTLFMPNSYSSLESDGTAVVKVSSLHFNNNNPYRAGDSRIAAVNSGRGGWSLNPAGRYGANAVVLCAHGELAAGGAKNVGSRVKGIRFVGDGAMGLVRTVILGRNTEDLKVEDCSITGIGMGFGVLLAGCNNYRVLRNKIYDCLESGIYPATAAGDAANCAPNVTAVGTTDDFVIDYGVSRYGLIEGNRIDNIHFVGAGLVRHGDQSDGINLAQMGQTSLTQISGNQISNVAEGMDIFEKYCLVNGNHLVACNIFGVKLIYSASYNGINNNTILNSGAAAIVCDSPNGHETRNNSGANNILYNAQSSRYLDNGLIQFSSSGSGSTHSNSFTGGEYAAVSAKTYVRNTANVGSNKSNSVQGRCLGPGTHSDPNQRYCSQSSAGIVLSLV